MKVGRFVALIVPKSLLSTPEFNKTREIMSKYRIEKICDYGEKAFKIKIETISFIINTTLSKSEMVNNKVKIESYITKSTKHLPQQYICCTKYPYWLIYRNDFLDKVSEKLIFNIFTTFRDRQITKKLLRENGKYRVLKSRNIDNLKIVKRNGHDKYVDDIKNLNIRKILNKKNYILIPNLTYFPRACFLPRNCITDGSVAIAILRNGYHITKDDLAYYSSNEFREFYRVARNLSSRTMNIDSNSIFFFGKQK